MDKKFYTTLSLALIVTIIFSFSSVTAVMEKPISSIYSNDAVGENQHQTKVETSTDSRNLLTKLDQPKVEVKNWWSKQYKKAKKKALRWVRKEIRNQAGKLVTKWVLT